MCKNNIKCILEVNKTEQVLLNAQKYTLFKGKCKKFLRQNGIYLDKFTMYENPNADNFYGYISEFAVYNYLKKFGKCKRWSDDFDLKRLNHIIKDNLVSPENIKYVRDFFFDKWDVCFFTRSNQPVYFDVKTAGTDKDVNDNWTFMYPVVQANRCGKQYSILTYCIAKNKVKELTEKVLLVGYISEEEIKEKEIIEAGQRTIHKTVSQINNYVTYVRDYKNLEELLLKLQFEKN